MLNRRRQTYIRKHKPKVGPRAMLTGFATVLCLFVALQLNAHPFPTSSALPKATLAADSIFYGHYPFIRFIDAQEDATLVRLSDKDFLDKAGKVVFKVSSYDTYTNDTLLHLLEKEIFPRIKQDSLRLRRIIVRGASSPDGPVPGNRMLSRRRSEALTLFLRAHLSVPVDEENISDEVVTEDYSLLQVMMDRTGDPAADTVRSLCKKHVPRYEYTILKNKLKKMQGGTLWRHLLKDYFPELRAARVVLVFDKPEAKEVNAPLEDSSQLSTVNSQLSTLNSQLSTLNSQLSTDKVPRRELLSVKTNLLLYGFYLPGGYNRWCPIPNVALEFYPKHGHFTYGASIDFPWWRSYNDFKFFEVRNYQVEARYYFRSGDIKRRKPGEGAAFRGWYLQGYAHVGLFNICFDKDSGYEGEFFGAGLGAGYVLPISRKGHWKLEFSLQAGFVYGKHDPYQFENLINPNYHDKLYYYRWAGKSEDFKLRQYRFSWIGPTRVGVTLTYDLLYLRGKKKGVSFRPWEKNIEH